MAYIFQNELHGKGTVSIPAGASGDDVQELSLAGINTNDSLTATMHINGTYVFLTEILGFVEGTDYQYIGQGRSVTQHVTE